MVLQVFYTSLYRSAFSTVNKIHWVDEELRKTPLEFKFVAIAHATKPRGKPLNPKILSLLVLLLSITSATTLPFDVARAQNSVSIAFRGLSACGATLANAKTQRALTAPPGKKSFDLTRLKTLSIMSHNFAYILELPSSDGSSSSGILMRPKASYKADWQARTILKSAPAILVGQEIENFENMNDFSNRKLGGLYESFLTHGNDRYKDVGLFADKRYPFFVESRSFAHLQWNDPSRNNAARPLFNRDAPAHIFRLMPLSQPFLIVIGVHSKSKHSKNSDGSDAESLRRLQHTQIAEIAKDFQKEFGERVPIVIAGDFNSSSPKSLDLTPINDLGFKDVLEITNTPLQRRVTGTYHPFHKEVIDDKEVIVQEETVYEQPDMIFVSPSAQHLVKSARVVHFEDSKGRPLPPPDTYFERQKRPSDHIPIEVVLDFQGLVELSNAIKGKKGKRNRL